VLDAGRESIWERWTVAQAKYAANKKAAVAVSGNLLILIILAIVIMLLFSYFLFKRLPNLVPAPPI